MTCPPSPVACGSQCTVLCTPYCAFRMLRCGRGRFQLPSSLGLGTAMCSSSISSVGPVGQKGCPFKQVWCGGNVAGVSLEVSHVQMVIRIPCSTPCSVLRTEHQSQPRFTSWPLPCRREILTSIWCLCLLGDTHWCASSKLEGKFLMP